MLHYIYLKNIPGVNRVWKGSGTHVRETCCRGLCMMTKHSHCVSLTWQRKWYLYITSCKPVSVSLFFYLSNTCTWTHTCTYTYTLPLSPWIVHLLKQIWYQLKVKEILQLPPNWEVFIFMVKVCLPNIRTAKWSNRRTVSLRALGW